MTTPEAGNNEEEPVMDYRSPTIHSSKLTMAGSSLHAQAPPSQELTIMDLAKEGCAHTRDRIHNYGYAGHRPATHQPLF